MCATYAPLGIEFFVGQHTSRNTFAFTRDVENDRHNHPWGKLIDELGLDQADRTVGYTGFHDGSDTNNLNTSCAENIIAYETNLYLGHSPEFSDLHSLAYMPTSKTIIKYKQGFFQNHKVYKAIMLAVPLIARYLRIKYPGENVFLSMSRQCDMVMSDNWKTSAKFAKEHQLRKSMHKGSPTTDIYVCSMKPDPLETISMKIGSSQLGSCSYTDRMALVNAICAEFPHIKHIA